MREFAISDERLSVMVHLDERQRRILAGATARMVGRGGIAAVAGGEDEPLDSSDRGARG